MMKRASKKAKQVAEPADSPITLLRFLVNLQQAALAANIDYSKAFVFLSELAKLNKIPTPKV